jgi:hypothetical protein
VPAVALAYEIWVFPTSKLAGGWALAFHNYFGGHFLVGNVRNYSDLPRELANPDFIRAIEQYRFTVPFYVGIGYAIGALASRSLNVLRDAKPDKSPLVNGC